MTEEESESEEVEEQKPLTAEQLRARLVQQLVTGGALRSPEITRAFSEVPRELFLPPEISLERAYSDDAIVVKWNEAKAATSSSTQPFLMADMLEALDLAPGMKVLEVGAGVGYNAAILANILGNGECLTSIDLDPAMAEVARQNLMKLGPPYERVSVVSGDGGHGYSAHAPYDRIIVTVQQWEISPDWVSQLKEGGILIAPLSISAHVWGGLIPAFRKEADGTLTAIAASHGGFMPMRGELAHPLAQQDETDGPPRSHPVKIGIMAQEILEELPSLATPEVYLTSAGLPTPILELLQSSEELTYTPDATIQFEVEELPPTSTRWNEMTPNQRRAARSYYGYTSLVAVAVEDLLSTLLINPNPLTLAGTGVGETENAEPLRSRFEGRGLGLVQRRPDETAFDLALLVAGTAYGWRVTQPHNSAEPTTTETDDNNKNLALAKLQEVWQVWQRLGQPVPSEYRPIAYPTTQPAPAPGYVIHRKYYNLLIPFNP